MIKNIGKIVFYASIVIAIIIALATPLFIGSILKMFLTAMLIVLLGFVVGLVLEGYYEREDAKYYLSLLRAQPSQALRALAVIDLDKFIDYLMLFKLFEYYFGRRGVELKELPKPELKAEEKVEVEKKEKEEVEVKVGRKKKERREERVVPTLYFEKKPIFRVRLFKYEFEFYVPVPKIKYARKVKVGEGVRVEESLL